MSLLLLVLLFALLSFGLSMAALALHGRHGLGPLLLALALLEGIKFFATGYIVVPLGVLGQVELGSLVSYVNLLVTVQAAYIRLGAGPTRELAWGLVALSVLTGLFSALLALLIQQPGVQVSPSLEPRALTLSVGVLLIGNACLLASLVTSVVLAQALLRRGVGLWLALVSSLVLVAGLDTVLFQLLAGHQELSWAGLRANLVGKSVMALLLGSLAAGFLRDVHRAHDDGPAARDLLAVMSFRRRLEALERELQTDVLTGLYNRRFLEREVPALLRLDRNRGRSTALVLVDLDHFKLINDRHGHLVGDQALVHVAKLLQQGVREDMDSVIRYGGEEFVLVVPGTSAAEAAQRTEELLQSLRDHPLALADGRQLPITATAGVAASPQDGEGWWELLQRADERLYAGKRAGRDRVVLESPP